MSQSATEMSQSVSEVNQCVSELSQCVSEVIQCDSVEDDEFVIELSQSEFGEGQSEVSQYDSVEEGQSVDEESQGAVSDASDMASCLRAEAAKNLRKQAKRMVSRSVAKLKTIEVGQLSKGGQWKPACISSPGNTPRSFHITTDDSHSYRRNRRSLKPYTAPPARDITAEANATTDTPAPLGQELQVTRSGRLVKAPQKKDLSKNTILMQTHKCTSH